MDAPSCVLGREWVPIGVPGEGWACFSVFCCTASKMPQIKSQTGAAAALDRKSFAPVHLPVNAGKRGGGDQPRPSS